mmetsp:Transcript_351/g.1067  ORF Transcript_351/g.1067 Transcript_351/m.1067 type:complete len:272 (-) Transcript_351:30-845(-)
MGTRCREGGGRSTAFRRQPGQTRLMGSTLKTRWARGERWPGGRVRSIGPRGIGFAGLRLEGVDPDELFGPPRDEGGIESAALGLPAGLRDVALGSFDGLRVAALHELGDDAIPQANEGLVDLTRVPLAEGLTHRLEEGGPNDRVVLGLDLVQHVARPEILQNGRDHFVFLQHVDHRAHRPDHPDRVLHQERIPRERLELELTVLRGTFHEAEQLRHLARRVEDVLEQHDARPLFPQRHHLLPALPEELDLLFREDQLSDVIVKHPPRLTRF